MKVVLGKRMSVGLLALFLPLLGNAQEKKDSQPLEITLERAVEIALSENPSVKVADIEIKKKKYAHRSTQSSLYPQIDAVGQYSRTLKKQVMYMDGSFDIAGMMGEAFAPLIAGAEKTFQDVPGYTPGTFGKNVAESQAPPAETSDDGGISVGRDNNWTAGFNVNWPIVVPTLWKSLELTSMDVEVAVEKARASKIDMINSIRKSFYGVLLAQDAYTVFKESYDNAELSYNDIKHKFDQGIVSEFDLIRADVNLKNIKPNLIQAQNALNLAQLSLKAMMGIDIDQEISVSGSLLDYEEGLYAELMGLNTSLEYNSDLKQFDLQSEQLQKTLGLYKAQYLPTVAITGSYMFMSMNNDFKFGDYRWNPYSTVGISVSIPIFDGLKKHNDIKQTKMSIEQMKWQREDIVRNLNLAINSNVSNMTNYVEQVISTKDVVAQAQKGYEISQKLYDTGMGTLLDLNSAQLGLTQASLAYNQAIYNFLASKADLDKILGIEPEAITTNDK